MVWSHDQPSEHDKKKEGRVWPNLKKGGKQYMVKLPTMDIWEWKSLEKSRS